MKERYGWLSFAAGLLILCSGAQGQIFTIWTEAPATVEQGGTYTVEFWARIDGPPFVQGVSAIAAFGFDGIATEGRDRVALNHGVVFADWVAVAFSDAGTVVGPDVIGVSGGQLAGFMWGIWPDLSHPVMLYSFDVTVGDSFGRITYSPGDLHPLGGLSFYPVWNSGESIIAPNDPGTSLVLVGATTRVIPGPGVIVALMLGGAVSSWRRRRR